MYESKALFQAKIAYKYGKSERNLFFIDLLCICRLYIPLSYQRRQTETKIETGHIFYVFFVDQLNCN